MVSAAVTTEATRRCYACKEVKCLSKFVPDRNRKLGRTYRCMQCARARYKTPEFRASNAARVRELRESDPDFRSREREVQARYAQANLIKRKVCSAVYRAIKDGRLQRGACEVCGTEKTEAHHDDYSQPLVVRWLCNVHHQAWHTENGEGKNAHG